MGTAPQAVVPIADVLATHFLERTISKPFSESKSIPLSGDSISENYRFFVWQRGDLGRRDTGHLAGKNPLASQRAVAAANSLLFWRGIATRPVL